MWNVLSLYRSGALRDLIQATQEYKTDLLVIQKVRWLGRSITENKNCTVYYSCDNIFLEQALLLVKASDR
jgi:CYTH domain-containing protein